MKYLKLFEGFLAEKEAEEVDSFGNKKKKKEDEEEEQGTVLSNTTGDLATAEVSEKKIKVFTGDKKDKNDISKWDDKTVDKAYGMYLDELSNDKREAEEKKKLNTAQKRDVLKKQQKGFEKNLK